MSSWYLNNDNEIVQDDFPEPIDYLTPPYPASMWYLDENNKLMNALLPYAGDIRIKNIYIGDNQVRKIYVGNKEVETAYLGNNEL